MEDTHSQKERLLEHFEEVPRAGMDLGDGIFETKEGVIRTPKSKLNKLKKAEIKTEPVVATPTSVLGPAIKLPVSSPLQTLVFETPMGKVYGQYAPVIRTDTFVVLGLSPQAFIPVSWKEDKRLKLTTTIEGKELHLVYTGCRFKDPDTNREYIVLMEVQS